MKGPVRLVVRGKIHAGGIHSSRMRSECLPASRNHPRIIAADQQGIRLMVEKHIPAKLSQCLIPLFTEMGIFIQHDPVRAAS